MLHPAAVQLGFSDLMMELVLSLAERDHDAAVAQTYVDAMAQLARCLGTVSDESDDQAPPTAQQTVTAQVGDGERRLGQLMAKHGQ